MRFEPNPAEVESVLVASLDDLAAGYEKRRLVRRGVPIKTDTYVVGGQADLGCDGPHSGHALRAPRPGGAMSFRTMPRL